MTLNKRTKIAFIGAGKLAFSLVPAMVKAGYNVNLIISRNIKSAKSLASKYKIPLYADNNEYLYKHSGVVFLTLPDSFLDVTARELMLYNLDFKKLFFVHTSGAMNLSVLEDLKSKGALTGSMHILQSFPNKRKVNIKGCYSAIQSSADKGTKYIKELSVSMGLIPFQLNEEDKVKYHLAAVFASNFLNAVIHGSETIFSDIKDSPDNHFKVFEVIINSVIKNIKNNGTEMALSGPVERGDLNTIQEHISALRKMDKRLLKSYAANSLLLLNMASEKHNKINHTELNNLSKIKKLLEKELRT